MPVDTPVPFSLKGGGHGGGRGVAKGGRGRVADLKVCVRPCLGIGGHLPEGRVSIGHLRRGEANRGGVVPRNHRAGT